MSGSGIKAASFASNPHAAHKMVIPTMPIEPDNGMGRIERPALVPRSELEEVERELAISREDSKMFAATAEKIQMTLETTQRELAEARRDLAQAEASRSTNATLLDRAITERDEARAQRDKLASLLEALTFECRRPFRIDPHDPALLDAEEALAAVKGGGE